ncbi:MAG TPA: lysylphosphatidylglycerol synthase transmembrane domain-containing protein [Pseudobdellovibrionaceae bacterium]|nr:lysylphosphatidylglycerol synthase transmembrane domain-containing protein [Pseudobdellovibrionaceae bacterium]
MQMTDRVKSILGSILKFLLAGGLIGWLVATDRLDLHAASALFRSPLVFLGFLLIGLNLWLVSERWRILVTPQNVPAGPLEVFRLTLIGVFFNYAMPGGVGGDVVKAYYFGKDHPQARAAAITSVILDRALGLYAMILMALLAMTYDYRHVLEQSTLRTLYFLLVLLGAGVSLFFLSIFSRRFKKTGFLERLLGGLPLSAKLLKLYETAHRFGLRRQRVISTLVLSFLSQSFAVIFLWVAAQAAGFDDVSLKTFFLVAPLGYMATAIPISPAGLGVGQAAFLVLFNLYLGRESDIGAIVITTQQVMTAIFGAIGALLYVQRKDRTSLATIESTVEEQ